eukprot:gene7301-8116_t
MVKILSYSNIRTLIRISRTCKTWRRLALDRDLWRVVDLTPYRYYFDENKTKSIIRTYLIDSIRKLSLQEFVITAQILRELSKCKDLRSMNLDRCTFIGEFSDNNLINSFPAKLHFLSMRHTGGVKSAMKIIRPRLVAVREFHATNKIIDDGTIEELFASLLSMRILKISNSKTIDCRAMQLMASNCSNLQCLSLKHCCNFTGKGLKEVLQQCHGLVELCFNGTELKDEFVMNINWKATGIRKLEISWCRNISDKGLQNSICQLRKLEYLKICSCNDGNALTDDLMQAIASSTSLSCLKDIDFSFSRVLTNEGVLTLTKCLKSLKFLSISHCRNLTSEILTSINSSTFITVTLPHSNLEEFDNFGRPQRRLLI